MCTSNNTAEEMKDEGELREKRLVKIYEQVDEIFNDMVGKFLTLLESWKVLEEHQDSDAKLADSRRRLIKQTVREIQGQIKDLDL